LKTTDYLFEIFDLPVNYLADARKELVAKRCGEMDVSDLNLLLFRLLKLMDLSSHLPLLPHDLLLQLIIDLLPQDPEKQTLLHLIGLVLLQLAISK
jgi:hypothetical protein